MTNTFLVMGIGVLVIYVLETDFVDLDHVVMDFYDHLFRGVMEIF